MTLARRVFYDGLAFHRVEPGFVVQGGDPKGDGTGGPVQDQGRVQQAAARARRARHGAHQRSRLGGSQFYIKLAPARQLDGQYNNRLRPRDLGHGAVDKIRVGDKIKTRQDPGSSASTPSATRKEIDRDAEGRDHPRQGGELEIEF